MNKPYRISPHDKYRLYISIGEKRDGEGAKKRGEGLITFFPCKEGGAYCRVGVNNLRGKIYCVLTFHLTTGHQLSVLNGSDLNLTPQHCYS